MGNGVVFVTPEGLGDSLWSVEFEHGTGFKVKASRCRNIMTAEATRLARDRVAHIMQSALLCESTSGIGPLNRGQSDQELVLAIFGNDYIN